MKIGNKTFDTNNNFYIMGIVNVTPDSFSDGGKYNNIEKAKLHIQEMIENGVDILDIGGESTRPNHTKITDDEEVSRVLPILKMIKENFEVPVSLDTYKSNVARECLPYIDMINDIWGLKHDLNMAKLIADNNLSCCIMHNRNTSEYNDFFEEMKSDLQESLDIALSAGISKDRIMIDAGVGFAKSYEQNLISINKTEQLKSFDLPILIATSNKSVIGLSTDTQVDDRLIGTVATTIIGASKGASFFRVHDVKENKQALMMTKSILNEERKGD